YVVYGAIPPNANLIKRYLRHFGAGWTTATPTTEDAQQAPDPAANRYAWRWRPELFESEFELRVAEHLQEFAAMYPNAQIQLYNQVESCGQKRLDFVLHNASNGECCAVEVDGCDHYNRDGRSYSDAHLDRVAILQRAGWKISHVPY